MPTESSKAAVDSLPSHAKIIHMVVGHTHHIITSLHQAGSKMVGHPENITIGGVLALLWGSALTNKNPFQVSEKHIARLQHMVHRLQQGRTIPSGRQVGRRRDNWSPA